MAYFNSTYIILVLLGCIYSSIAPNQGGTDGFFFFSAAGGISPGVVANVIQGKLQNFLGKDVTVKPFEEPETKPVKCDKDLDCDFKNRTCRWHNILNDAGSSVIQDVYVGGGRPNASGVAILKNFIFGTDELPNGQFGLVASPQINASRILFCSDPVPFPEPKPGTEGILSLKSWIMNKIMMKACIRLWDPLNKKNDKTSPQRKWPINWLGCSKDISYGENAGPNKLKINLSDSYQAMQNLAKKYNKPQSATQGLTYEVCLMMGPFPGKRGNMVFFDDITWESGLCNN